jgi:type II secretory pathway component PulF
MPAFRYVALEPEGTPLCGVMEAPDRQTVIERLQRV